MTEQARVELEDRPLAVTTTSMPKTTTRSHGTADTTTLIRTVTQAGEMSTTGVTKTMHLHHDGTVAKRNLHRRRRKLEPIQRFLRRR
jgi:hypothetical protein